MNKLYDKNPIYDEINESYVGYGKNDLSSMTRNELEKELARTNDEINDIKNEVSDAETFPSYVLKEKLTNAEDYRDKIKSALDNMNTYKEAVFDKMTYDLGVQFNKGLITEEYYNDMVKKLAERKEMFLENCDRYPEIKTNSNEKKGFKAKFLKKLSYYKK